MHKPLVLRLFLALVVLPVGFSVGEILIYGGINWREYGPRLIFFVAGATSYALTDWWAERGTSYSRGD
jgi:hypothetical protein